MTQLDETELRELERVESEVSARYAGPNAFAERAREWGDFVKSVEAGYGFSVYDYTNDLCIRDILQEILDQLSFELRAKLLVGVAHIDKRFLATSEPALRPLTASSKPGEWWCRVPRIRKD